MNYAKTLPAGFLALVLIGTGAVVATAQDTGTDVPAPAAQEQMQKVHARDGDRHRGGKHHRGDRHGRGGGEMFRTLFDEVDADGDGAVTQEEIDAYRTAKLAEVDTSGDGALSIEEFDTLYREFTRARMVDTFQRLDADGDGGISAAEMDRRIDGMVQRMDRDGDGTLTLQRGRKG